MKLIKIAIAVFIMALLLPGIAFASDISGARYSGTVRVTDNATAATDVSTVFTLSSADMVNLFGVSDNFSNVAIRTNGGADAAFQPSVNATYPWSLFVPAIGASSSLDYRMYAGGGDMEGKPRYFPGSGGMTIADDSSMEPSANYTMVLPAFINTTAGANDTLIKKPAAAHVYVSDTVSGNITADIYEITTVTQTSQNTDSAAIYSGGRTRYGQRINSFNASDVISFSFYIKKVGSPTGTATIRARQVSDDTVLGTLGTLDVSTLTTSYVEHTYTTLVNNPSTQDIRVSFEYSGGDGSNHVKLGIDNANPYAGGVATEYTASWSDVTGSDAYFKISYSSVATSISATGVTSGENTITLTSKPYVNLNGSTGIISAADQSWLKFGAGSFSVSIWIKTSQNAGSTYPILMSKEDENSPRYGWAIWQNSGAPDNKVMFALESNNVEKKITGPTINDGEWHHLALVRDGTSYLYGYVDGASVGAPVSLSGYGSTDKNGVPVDIGNRTGKANRASSGNFSEALIFNRALSPAEVATLAAGGEVSNGIVGKWMLDEGTGTNANDTSGYNNDATITGGAWANKLTLDIDGTTYEVDPAVSVPDTQYDWVIGGDATPYIEYFKLYAGGGLASYIAWEYNTTFTDLSGNGNDATPTFRTTSSHAHVSASLISWAPVSQARASSTVLGSAGELVTEAPAQPEKLYIPEEEISLFFAPLINAVLDAGNVPRPLFWYTVSFIFIIGLGYVSFKFNRSMLVTSGVMWAAMFLCVMLNIFGGWTLVYFSCEMYGILIMSRHYGW